MPDRSPESAADRILQQWQPHLEQLTDDTYETITLLVRGTCQASQLNERYDLTALAHELDTTTKALFTRFCRFRVPSLRNIQSRVWLLCIIDRREDLARRWYTHRYSLCDAYGAAGLSTLQALARFLRRTVPAMRSASDWIRTADFADVATEGARFLFSSPNWRGFHAIERNHYTYHAETVPVQCCSECGRPAYGRERAAP